MGNDAQWLNDICKHHDKWVSLVKKFNIQDWMAEDIVHEAYLALYKYTKPEKIIHNGKVSDGYMFFTLKTISYQFHNSKNKIQKVSIDDDDTFLQLAFDDSSIEEQEAFHKICKLVDEEMENWSWYNRRLTELYRDTDLSIRGIAGNTNISFVSIFNTLKNCKQQIKNQLYEEWQDYQNGEFERIKNPKNDV